MTSKPTFELIEYVSVDYSLDIVNNICYYCGGYICKPCKNNKHNRSIYYRRGLRNRKLVYYHDCCVNDNSKN